MEKYHLIQPSFVLAPYVKHYWLLKSDDVASCQRIIPSGNIELIFHRGSQMIRNNSKIPITSISGQSTSFSDLIPTGVVDMIVVVFHSFGARAFLGIPVYELNNLVVSSVDINIKGLKELEDKILNSSDDKACIEMIETFLINSLTPFKEYNYKRLVSAVNTIDLCGNMSVSLLAQRVCLSNKQFQRLFKEHVGATPKEFMRIVRFHKALFILQNNPMISFSHLAYECGYYDQAHMINEFKLFSGYTPTKYISLCNPYSDYFS